MNSNKTWTHNSFTIHEFTELESTNKTAFELASLNKISDHEIISAKSQTKGKGRKDRSWSSPEGNLYFSLLLRPKITLTKIPQISFLGIVALRLAMAKIFAEEKISAELENKWPNDLLINRKKCAGLLLESKISAENCEFVVLGIGLNIASNPDQTIFPATNLKNFNVEISPQFALESFLNEFEKIYENFLSYGFAGVRKLWLQSAFNLRKEISVKLDEKEVLGIFKDLDEDGNLVLDCAGEIIKINSGDVINL